jgi:hypothetical protein
LIGLFFSPRLSVKKHPGKISHPKTWRLSALVAFFLAAEKSEFPRNISPAIHSKSSQNLPGKIFFVGSGLSVTIGAG